MPVPLIFSDLPPKVEQPVASTAAAVEHGPSSDIPSLSGTVNGASQGSVSLLSDLLVDGDDKPPAKTVYSVLPLWLLGESAQPPVDLIRPRSSLPLAQSTPEASSPGAEPTPADEAVEESEPGPGGGAADAVPSQDGEASPTAPEFDQQRPGAADGDGLDDESLSDPMGPDEVAELILRADQQVYDPTQQTVTAVGDVLVQFGNAQLAAERLWVNLENRYIRAEGDVFFNRNEQVIEGDTATYNLLQGSGEITDVRGELMLSTLGADLATLPFANEPIGNVPIDYRLQREGTISTATSPEGITLGTDARSVFGGERGDVSRLRFEGEKIYFDADGWYAEDLRITNDPFSPPELEIRGNQVQLRPLNEEEAELYIQNPRIVFDQGLTLPLFKERYILQRGQLAPNELNPLPTGIGIDGRDRNGLFIERQFSIDTNSPWRFTVVPQFYIGRWLGESDYDLFDPANFGVVAQLNGPLGPRTFATGILSLPGLDLENFSDRLRASFRTRQLIGTHELSLEYSYRDRLFNGSLGFQDVQTSLGVLLQSPEITLGNTQINLTYQASGQYVTADTDQPSLLPPGEGVGLTSLFRFQGAVDLSRQVTLWEGEPLPATPTEGLRYSPRPLVPSLSLGAGIRGVATYYTNNALQETLEARISLSGQLGHLRRNYLDFTQFNIGYSTSFISGDESPFLFDRAVDRNVLSGGIIQQIYGPLLAGVQTSFNLDTGEEIDTDFIVEYRRRAYGVFFQYSPTRETGFLGFRLSDFNWTGRTRPFDVTDSPASPDETEVIVE